MKLIYEAPELEIYKFPIRSDILMNASRTVEGDLTIGEAFSDDDEDDPFG